MMFGHGRSIARVLLAAASLAVGSAQSADQSGPAEGANTSTQIRNATSGGIQDRSSKSPAEALFVDKCGACHRQMGMGTVLLARRMAASVAMLEARRDLPEAFIVEAARAGIGNMPRISRGEVSGVQLATIARYLAKANE